MAIRQPVEHIGPGQNGPNWIGYTLAGDVRSRAVGCLEVTQAVAQLRSGGNAQPSHRGRTDIGNDVAEHVLRHNDIVMVGPGDQIGRQSVHHGVLHLDIRIIPGDFSANLAEESVGAQYIGLVTDRHPFFTVRRSALSFAGQPTTTWLPFLHTGRAYATNCDFMCMISSKMFQEAFLPSLLKEIEYLDRNVFHLDGPGALKHLDTMLALEQLDALQWVFGDGNGPSQKWIEVYRKGQAAGKALQIFADSPEEARRIADHIQPNGVWFIISKACSQGEVKSLTKWLEGWAAEKR